MRITGSVLSYVLAFMIGVALVPLPTLFVEWFNPTFTREEAAAMIGHRFRNIYRADGYREFKCPDRFGLCEEVTAGEQGTAIGIEKCSFGGYFIVVQWDDPPQGEPMFSYFGRKTRRIFLSEE